MSYSIIDTDQTVIHGRCVEIATCCDDMGPPWREYHGHGPVRECRPRANKRPGERILGNGYAYDWQAAIKTAKKDCWCDCINICMMLAWKHKRAPTKGMVAEYAVECDFQYLKGWCNDDWCYVFCTVTDVETGVSGYTCGGLESTDTAGIAEAVSETVDEMWDEVLKAILEGEVV